MTTRHDIVGDAIRAALTERARIRADFDLYIDARMDVAEEHTRSAGFLNARGRAAGIDPRSLFYGPAVRVKAYASEELQVFFQQHGRTTYAMFEQTSRTDPWQ